MFDIHISLSEADMKALQEATHESDPQRCLSKWVHRARRWRAAREQALAAYEPSRKVVAKALKAAAEIDRREKNGKSKSSTARVAGRGPGKLNLSLAMRFEERLETRAELRILFEAIDDRVVVEQEQGLLGQPGKV